MIKHPALFQPDDQSGAVVGGPLWALGEDVYKRQVGNSDVPVGQYSQKIFAYYGLDQAQMDAAGVLTYGSNVKEVTTAVSEGTVDLSLIHILGLPGCVMYAKATIFDLLLPRIVADVPITRWEIKRLGNGGLCLGCGQCHYPICPFGKGD